MSAYLMRFSYTSETWAALMEHPEDRSEAAREYIEAVGGSLLGFWYGFGEYDGYCIFDAPDEIAVMGVVKAITAGGALGAVQVTPLMTVHDTLDALERGRAVRYRRPGAPAMAHSGGNGRH